MSRDMKSRKQSSVDMITPNGSTRSADIYIISMSKLSQEGVSEDSINKQHLNTDPSLCNNGYTSKHDNKIKSSQIKKYENTNKKYIVFVCAFMSRFLISGFAAMISVMFVDVVREFNASRSEASLMQSLVKGFMYGGGVFGEIIFRKVGYTKSILLGCTLSSMSLMASAFATNVTMVVILVGVGTGSGLMLPMLSTFLSIGRAFDSSSFPKYMAYTIAGGGAGSMLLPYMAEIILEEYGWRGMCMLMSGVLANLFLLAIFAHFNLPKTEPSEQKTKRNNWSILRNPTYVTCMGLSIITGLSGFVELWYVPDYLVTLGYTREQGSILLTVIGATNTFGRLLPGIIYPICTYTRTKVIYHLTYLFLLLAISHLIFPLFPTYSILFVASTFYGIFLGMIGSQFSAITLEAVGKIHYPAAQGLANTLFGIFASLGGVFAGSIRDKTGSYDMVFYEAAISSLLGSSLIIALLMYKRIKRKLQKIPNSEVTHF